MPSSTEWAYAAGLFDGEGCIQVAMTNQGRGYQLRLTLTQVDPDPIRWLSVHIGGRTKTSLRDDQLRYDWGVYSQAEVVRILNGMYPYLTVKRRQAEVALTWKPQAARPELQRLKRLHRAA